MPNAFDSFDKARGYLVSRGGNKAFWTVRLAVEPGMAHHSLVNVYANGQFVGTLQLFLLGPALYYDDKQQWPESGIAAVSWFKLIQAVRWTYDHPIPWGLTGLCHDYCAIVLDIMGYTIANPSPTASGSLYVGGRIIGVPLSIGTGGVMAAHKAWNALQDSWKAGQRDIGAGWESFYRAFSHNRIDQQ